MADLSWDAFQKYNNRAASSPSYNSPSGNLSWDNFYNYRNQIAQANQQMNYNEEDKAHRSDSVKRDDGRYYRKMTGGENLFAHVNDVTNALSSYSGWDPEKGWTPENITRFMVGLPGMMLSAPTDLLARGYETLSGSKVTEADTSTGYIPDETMTGTERAANLGYIATDLLSFIPGLAPEAKLAGVGLKGIGRAAGIESKAVKELSDVAAKGLIKKSGLIEGMGKSAGWSEGKIRAAKALDSAAGIGASTIFEGTQEGVQQGFEDLRYGNFDENTMDRMIEAATWGGLGGFAMGGVSTAVDTALDKRSAKTRSMTDGERTSTPQILDKDPWDMTPEKHSGYLPLSINQDILEQARSDDRLARGGIMAENVSANPNLRVDQMDAGAEDFAEAFTNGKESNQRGLALQICNVNRQEANEEKIAAAVAETKLAISDFKVADNNGVIHSYSTLEDALNALLAKHWGKNRGFRAAWEKSPATKNRGGYLNVVKFHAGRGMIVNPYVAPMTGMDFDGDKSAVFFNTFTEKGGNLLNLIGYASDIMLSREGVYQSDTWYSDFTPRRFNAGLFKKALKDAFRFYNIDDKILESYVERMNEAVKSDDKAAVPSLLMEIADSYDSLRKDLEARKDEFKEKNLPGKRAIINDLFGYAPKNYAGRIDDIVEEFYKPNAMQAVLDDVLGDESIPEEVKEDISFVLAGTKDTSFARERGTLYSQGTIGDNPNLTSHYQDLGLVIWTIVTGENPIFRQQGELNITKAKKQYALADIMDASRYGLRTESFSTLVRISFRIARATATPLSAIEGLLDLSTRGKTDQGFGFAKGNRISSAENFDSFQEELRKAWNDDAKTYEEVKQIEGQGGYAEDFFAPVRNEINEGDTRSLDSLMIRLYGMTNMEDIFGRRAVDEFYWEMPLNAVLERFAVDPGIFSQIFTESGDPEFEKRMDRLFSAYGREKKRVGTQSLNLFESYSVSDLVKRMEDNGGKLAKRDYAAAIWLFNMIVDKIGPEFAESMGLTDPIHFFENTDLGKMFLSEDFEVRKNAYVSLLAKSRFFTIQAILDNRYGLEGEKLENARAWAIRTLEEYAAQGTLAPLRYLIAKQFLSGEKKSKILNVITDTSVPLSQKVNVLETHLGAIFPNMDIVTDFLVEDAGDFSISSISRSHQKAEASVQKYTEFLYEDSEKAKNTLFTKAETGEISKEAVQSALMASATAAKIRINTEPYVVGIIDSLRGGHKWAEKGVSPKSFSAAGESMIFVQDGSALSYIDQLTSAAAGGMSSSDLAYNRNLFCSMLSSPRDKIRVYFTSNGKIKCKYISGNKIFSEVSTGYDPQRGPQYEDWKALLDYAPHLEAWLSDCSTQPVQAGTEGSATLAKESNIYQTVLNHQATVESVVEGTDVDPREIYQVDYAINEIKNLLLNDIDFLCDMMIPCFDDLGIPSNAEPAVIKKNFDHLLDAFATSYYFHTQKRSGKDVTGSVYKTERAKYIARVERSYHENMDTLFSALDEMIDYQKMDWSDSLKLVRLQTAETNKRNFLRYLDRELAKVFKAESSAEITEDKRLDAIYSASGQARLRSIKMKVRLEQLEYIAAIQSSVEISGQIESDFDYDIPESNGATWGFDREEANQLLAGLVTGKYAANEDSLTPEQKEAIAFLEEYGYDDFSEKNNFNIIRMKQEESDLRSLEDLILDNAVSDLNSDEEYINDLVREKSISEEDAKEIRSRLNVARNSLFDSIVEEGSIEKLDAPILNRLQETFPIKVESRSALTDIIRDLESRIDEARRFAGDALSLKEYSDLSDLYIENENGEFFLNIKKRDKLVHDTNNLIASVIVKNLEADWQVEINENGFAFQDKFIDSFSRLEDEIYTLLSEKKNPLDPNGSLLVDSTDQLDRIRKTKYEGKASFPSPSFSSAVNTAASSNMRVGLSGSLVVGNINRNGGSLKECSGLAYLSPNLQGTIEPRALTLEQLRSLRESPEYGEEMDRWYYVQAGTWSPEDGSLGRDWTTSTLGNILNDREHFSDDAVIQVLWPEDNPNGLWATNTPAAPYEKNRPSLRFPNITGCIIDTSQEGMVLQAKKRFEARVKLLAKRQKSSISDLSLIVSNTDLLSEDTEQVREKSKQLLLRYRRGLAAEINKAFQDDAQLKKTNFGKEQARIFSQGITPAVVLSAGNREYAISAYKLWDSDLFAQRAAEIVAEIGAENLASVEITVLVVSPKEISTKINESIEEYNRNLLKTKDKLSRDVVNARAYAAATEWDDYIDNDIKAEDVLFSYNPLGRARGNTIATENSLTAYQQFLGQSLEGKTPAVVTASYEGCTPINKDSSLFTASKVVSKKIFGKKASRRIIKIFCTDNQANSLGLKTDSINSIEQLRSAGNVFWGGTEGPGVGCALVLDPEEIDKAVSWARKTNNKIAVSNNVLRSIPDEDRLSWSYTYTSGEYTMLDPSHTAVGSAIDMAKTSPVTYLNPDSIEGCYIDGVSAHLYNLGDSDVWVSDDYSTSMVLHDAKKTSIKSLTGGVVGQRDFLSKTDADKMLSLLFDNNGSPKEASEWEKAGFYLKAAEFKDMKFQVLASKIRDYLLCVKNGLVGDDGVKHSGAGRSQVISILKLVRADGEAVYAPIITPANSPQSYDRCYLCQDDLGSLYIGYSKAGSMTEEEGWFFKVSLENEFFKGIASAAPSGIKFLEYEDGKKIKMIATNDTEKSRSPGRELLLFKSSMWYFSKKKNMSILFNPDGSVKENIRKAYTEKRADPETGEVTTVVNENGLADLLRGERSEWEKVASGSIRFFQGDDDVSKARNDAIQKVLKASLGKAPVMHLFSHIGKDSGVNTKTDISFFMALKTLTLDETLAFFSCFDETLCPHSSFEPVMHDRFWFRADGTFRCKKDNKIFYAPVRWAPHDAAGNFSALEGPGGEARESNQGLVRLSLEQEVLNKDLQTLIDFSSFLVGNPEFYNQRRIDKIAREGVKESKPGKTPSIKRKSEIIDSKYDTAKELAHRLAVQDIALTYKPGYEADIFDSAGNDRSSDWFDDPEIVAARGALTKATGVDWHQRTLYCFIADQLGHTYQSENASIKKGTSSKGKMELSDMVWAIRKMAESAQKDGLLIVAYRTMEEDRVSMPALNEEFAKLLWNCDTIKFHPANTNEELGIPDFEKFKDRMIEQQELADEYIRSLPPSMRAKQRALQKASEYHFMQWGVPYSDRLYENNYSQDLIHSTDWFSEMLREEGVFQDFDIDEFKKLERQGLQALKDQKKREEGQASMKRVTPSQSGVTMYAYKNEAARPFTRVFRDATDITRMQGLFDLFIPISNIGYRAVNQTIIDATLSLGQRGHGPYKVNQGINQDIVRNVAANDPEGYKIWIAMHEAALSRDELNFMMTLGSEAELDQWLKEKSKGGTGIRGGFNRFKRALYKTASGGGFGMKKQLINFLNRIVCYFNEDPVLKAYWLTPDQGTGLTRMDEMLAEPGGLAMFLKEVFHGGETGSASYLAGMNALQSVRTADLAQDHIAIEMFKNATNKHPLPEFLVSTLITRFPAYSLNFTEKILNYVLPIASLRYVFTDFVAQRAHEKAEKSGGAYIDPHYERLQRNTSLREALLVDMCHLGAGLVAMLIAALPGAIEPPADDDKWGNPEEWLVFGFRVGEAWWIEDIMGLALPLAAYHKSVMLGKPRLDILVNGITDVCYSNPMFKISDAVSFMMDPLDGLYNDYETQLEKYRNSRNGELSFLDYINTGATTFGWSYVSQFFTPTFVKSAWNIIMPYEADYRHVYQENNRGVLTEQGSSGSKLIETSYDDAMLRRLTRRNPVLALIIDLTHPGNTAYSTLGFPGKMAMPLTVYNDQHQYQYMKTWSINGLSEQDAQAKILQILVTLEQYQDNLDELISTGFYLDSGTKKAVSEAMWDRYYAIDDQWNQMQEEGMLDFYYLGNGDYNAGRTKYYEYKELKDKTKRYYSDLYYKTMKSEQLSRGMVTYNRYNTSYAQDDNGEWYATGFKSSGVLPFTFAPGTLTSPEGTAGYENDFVTISEVDGLPLENMRALVPTNSGEYEEWPELKFWSADSDGNGYSEQYTKWMGSDGTSTSTSTSSKTSGSSGSRGGYSGGSGGSGGSRSYAPSTYAPSVSLSKSNPSRIMNVNRPAKPNYDYLRPDFETKGSREAYRRSDI